MGRTVPSFRIVLEEEKEEWKDYRKHLDKSERKEFDDMWDIPRLYITACSNSVQLVPLQPIFISILFHHYKELMELKAQVEQKKEEGKDRISLARIRTKDVVEDRYVTNTDTLDTYFVINSKK
jgi:hypothetical protein